MAVTVVPGVEVPPEQLMGSAATAVALLFLAFMMFGSLMLALSEMKTERLGGRARRPSRGLKKKAAKVEADIENEDAPAVSSKAAKRRARGGRCHRSKARRLLEFFIADGSPEEAEDSEDGDDSAFQLDDEAWLEPGRAPPLLATEHFQIGEVESPRYPEGGAFDLPDEIWRAPRICADTGSRNHVIS
jgi:hypothetical protein